MTQILSVDQQMRRAAYEERESPVLRAQCPMLDLLAEGMPQAGPNMVAHAVQLGDSYEVSKTNKLKEVPAGDRLVMLYRRMLYEVGFKFPALLKTARVEVHSLPGHLWSVPAERDPSAYGPRPARVMVVGKLPGKYELKHNDYTNGSGMTTLYETLREIGISDAVLRSWYVTAACKFALDGKEITAVPAAWLKDSAIALEQEIRLVEPDFILCLGNEATKAVLRLTSSPSGLAGRALTRPSVDRHGQPRDIQVMSVMHPAYVARRPEAKGDLIGQLQRFKGLLDDTLCVAETVDHADIYTEAALTDLVDEMLADPDPNANIIAVDCEWNGDYPNEPGAYLRTIQVSNKDKWARTIVLRHQGGREAFKPNLDAARTQLARLLKSTPTRHVRIGGHFLRADLPWLIDFGLDLRPEYAPATDAEDRSRGGWDTSLLYHAINECARYGLDQCSMRFTAAPTYWEALDTWKKKRKKQEKSDEEGAGYGECPAHILHPYASYDADVTRRIMMYFYGTDGHDGAIAHDAHNNDCWRPYWVAHSASLAFLEMEQTGLEIDRDRADALTTLFMNTQEQLLNEIRDELAWPTFNPKSQPQLAVALFGEAYGTRYTNAPDVPSDAKLLNLPPIKTTGKRPVLWAEMGQRGVDPETATPSTDKESLGILGHINSTAAKIRDYKFISQVLQSVLRKPTATDDGELEVDENGNYTYQKGLVGCVHRDGKVRTHMFQTKETGRASSSRPPLQNLSKKREDDYRRILGPRYEHPVRSILRVPEGSVGIETDLTGAELAVLAWLSQDENMIDHVRRNNLPANHPEHYDIHSRQAVKAFNLVGVEPTKEGLASIGKSGMRVAAKNVNFGIPYGRGAEAIARQCKEEGVAVTVKECEAMINAYFDSYPRTKDFLAECRARSQSPGWLVGPYGRFRRFASPSRDDLVVRGEQERQAQNFPIQGGVADAVSIALNNMLVYRQEHPEVEFQITLQIHDAIVLTVPIAHAERVYKEMIPLCMVDQVPFYPRQLDGGLIPGCGPYFFGVDREVFVHWGEKLDKKQAEKMGLNWLFSGG